MQISLSPTTDTINLKISYDNINLFAVQFDKMLESVQSTMPTHHNLAGWNLPDELDIDTLALFKKRLVISALTSALRRFLRRLQALEDKDKFVRISTQKLQRNPQGDIYSAEVSKASPKLFLVKLTYPEAVAYEFYMLNFPDIFEPSTQAITNSLLAFINQHIDILVNSVEKTYPKELKETVYFIDNSCNISTNQP